MKKIDDRITLGLTSGFIGNLGKTFGNVISYKLGTSKILYGQFAAGVFGQAEDVEKDKVTIGVGQFIDAVVYSALGIPLTYILCRTGKDNHLLKGAGFGLMASILIYGVTPKLGITNVRPQKGTQHIAAMVNHLSYGLMTAESIVRLGKPGIFPTKAGMNSKADTDSSEAQFSATGRGAGKQIHDAPDTENDNLHL